VGLLDKHTRSSSSNSNLMASTASDPFLVVKEEVESSIKNAQALCTRWEQLFNDRKADKSEFEWTTSELRTNLKSIEWDLEDLSETVAIVKQTPDKFQLSAAEIKTREEFITRMTMVLKDMQNKTSEARVKAKKEEGNRESLVGSAKHSRYDKIQKGIQEENQDFINQQQQQQSMIMREQDTQLEEVHQAVTTLKQMGEQISDELDDHNDLLEEFQGEMTSTTDRLRGVMEKVDKTLAITRDAKQSCCICILIIIVFILMLVFITR